MVTWNPDKTKTNVVHSLSATSGHTMYCWNSQFLCHRTSVHGCTASTVAHALREVQKLRSRHLRFWWFNDWGYFAQELPFIRFCPVSFMYFLLDYTLKVVYGPYLGTIWTVLYCLPMHGMPESPRRWMYAGRSGLLPGHIRKHSSCLGILLPKMEPSNVVWYVCANIRLSDSKTSTRNADLDKTEI